MNERVWSDRSTQLFSYYPKYEYLDNVMTSTGKDRLNLYIDVKSCGQALFQEWAVKKIIFQSVGANVIDTSLFTAMMEFISFHKVYAKKRNIDLHIYMFMETGKSEYHLSVHDKYKSNRHSDDFFGLETDKKDLYFNVLQKNYIVAEKVSNKLPDVSYILLSQMEADFIPYYLMDRAMDPVDVDSAANIIYSLDKDMLQCLTSPNIFQFYKHYKTIKMITHKDVYSHWLKTDPGYDMDNEWFSMALAIVGDAADCFEGVRGVGPKTVVRIFEDIKDSCIGDSIDDVYNNIKANKNIFKPDVVTKNKALRKVLDAEDIIIRNLKLASYSLLADYVDGDYPSEVFKKKKIIMDSVNNKSKCTNPQVLHSALRTIGQSDILSEQTLCNLCSV